ncbi:MAG: hypothetical protein ABI432_16700 [Flavobacteriales bacterium]
MGSNRDLGQEPIFEVFIDSQSRSFWKVISWKIEQLQRRESSTPESDLSRSLIIDLSGFVEALLSEILLVATNVNLPLIIEGLHQKGTANNRLVRDFHARLEAATWSQYDELVRIALGKSLSKHVPNEIWKGLQHLATLRNMLSHGKAPHYTASRSVKGTIDLRFHSKYDAVYTYLVEKKVVPQMKSIRESVQLISSDTLNHFIDTVNAFLVAMNQALSEEMRESLTMLKTMRPLPRL